MTKFKSPVPLWAGYPLLFILGVGTGIIASGYEWSSNGYQLLPSEVIITPPPPNVTWCFPNTSLKTAIQIRTALAGKLHEDPAFSSVDSTQIAAVIKQLNNEPQIRGWYPITLLRQQKSRYEILVQGITGDITLATEEGTFYLHQIPERFHEKYDSLVQARHQ